MRPWGWAGTSLTAVLGRRAGLSGRGVQSTGKGRASVRQPVPPLVTTTEGFWPKPAVLLYSDVVSDCFVFSCHCSRRLLLVVLQACKCQLSGRLLITGNILAQGIMGKWVLHRPSCCPRYLFSNSRPAQRTVSFLAGACNFWKWFSLKFSICVRGKLETKTQFWQTRSHTIWTVHSVFPLLPVADPSIHTSVFMDSCVGAKGRWQGWWFQDSSTLHEHWREHLYPN